MLVFVVLGAAAGQILRPSGAPTFETNAVVHISPPQNALGGSAFVSDPDRYVLSQISAMQSTAIAEQVATQLPGETTQTVASSMRITQRPKTDIVDVFATSTSPERSAALANAYAQQYIASLRTKVGADQSPEVQAIDDQLTVLQTKLADLEHKLTPVASNANPTGTLAPDPSSVAERETTLQQYSKLLDTRTQLNLSSTLKVTSEVIQAAPVPKVPVAVRGKLLLAVGILAGLVLGLAAALVAARFSAFVNDERQVEELVGQPSAGRFALGVNAPGPVPAALHVLPPALETAVAELCVRAQVHEGDDGSLTIAVIGAQRGAGASSLAIAVAGRLARSGSSVLLIDADQISQQISTAFCGEHDGGIAELLRADGIDAPAAAGRRRTSEHRSGPFTATEMPDVRVLGVGPAGSSPVLRSSNVALLIDEVRDQAQVLVIDGGTLLATATAVPLVQVADAVVLAVSVPGQRVSTLEAVAHQLRGLHEHLLPVITVPPSRWARRHQRVPAPTPAV